MQQSIKKKCIIILNKVPRQPVYADTTHTAKIVLTNTYPSHMQEQVYFQTDNIMIDNKQHNKPLNTLITSIQQQQKQQMLKDNTQKPQYASQQHKLQDDIEQQPTKVLRNSSSQYDSVLQNFYKKQQQNDAKSTFKQGKNQREIKQQIIFIIDKAQKGVIAAYFIANKQSNTGVFSHQRFFVVDLIAKEIKYYTNTPHLPLKSVQEIVDKPKECIRFSQKKKISVANPKKGIGQLQIRWTQDSQTKQWKLKLGNNVMAKQLMKLIDSLKLGKPITVDEIQKPKEKIIKQLNSPRNKSSSLNKSWIGTAKKVSVPNTKTGPSNLSNLLLQSMMNANQNMIENESEIVKKQRVKIILPKINPTGEQEIAVAKETPKSLKIESSILNENIVKPQLKKEQQIKGIQQQIIQVKAVNQKSQPLIKQSSQAIVSELHNNPINHEQIHQTQANNPRSSNLIQPINNYELKPQNKANSIKSIRLQEIIKNASIQYQQQQKSQLDQPQLIPISIAQIDKPRKSQLEAVIQRRKQIQEQSTPTQRTLNNKQQLPMSKIIVKNILQNTTESKTLELSRKKSINDEKLKQSKQKNEAYYQSIATPKQPYVRQHLLQERKYAQTVKVTGKRQVKIMNTHNHPRKQRSRSNSASNKIQDYIQLQKQQKKPQNDWVLKWLTAQNSSQRGILYKKIIDEFKQKVTGLTKKFSSWHLFHKEGEQYIVKEGQIQMEYVIMASEDIGQWHNSQSQYLRRCNELSYVWNMTAAGKQLDTSTYKVIIAPTCTVSYKGLKVFCKLDLQSTKLSFTDVSFTLQYDQLMVQISRKCHCNVKSIQLYQLKIANKKYLYVQSIQVQPSIHKQFTYYLNQVYVNTYVAGVINLQDHLQKIHNHHLSFVISQFASLLSQFIPLSTLQLQAEMIKLGMDRSALPLAYFYCKQKQLARQNKIIISQLCACVISQNIRRGIHQILLSKVAQKKIEEQIYSLLMVNLRMDDQTISHTMQLKYHLNLTLQQIRNNVIEQYFIASLLINLGIKCNLKVQTDLKYSQKLRELFWQQFQFSQQTVTLIWECKTKHYSPIALHQNANYLEYLFYANKVKQQQNKFIYNRQHLIQYFSAAQSKYYHQSWIFLLLSQSQQELIKSMIAQEQPNIPTIQWENQLHPFYHLKRTPLLYYSTFNTYQYAILPVRNLIREKRYQSAQKLLQVQFLRAWIWGSHNPKLLVDILLLKSQLNQLLCKQMECIESILQGLRISIKYYELSVFKLLDVLKLCQKVASLHVRHHKQRKAIQFYQTCISLFQKGVDQSPDTAELFNTSIAIYNQRVRVYLKLGDYLKVEQSVKGNMVSFINWKERLHQHSDILSAIQWQQFECYSLMFRVYQIRRKYIELVQLMEDCCVKYIENHLQLLIQTNSKITIDEQQLQQYTQILKNIWVAAIANSNHYKKPTYQQYFNYYYSPLRNVKLNVVKDILLRIRKIHKGVAPFEKEQALNQLMSLLANKIRQNKSKEQNGQNKRPKSILVIGVIDCLSLLSLSQHTPQVQNAYELNQLLVLQQLISVINFQYALGILQFYSREYNLQL